MLAVTLSKAYMMPRIAADNIDAADDRVDEQTADMSQLTMEDMLHQKEILCEA
jgi:hypothetical protein